MTERGHTTLETRVVERIAAHAVTEEFDHAAKVKARVDGEAATLDVRLSVAYPLSVAEATERARAHLIRRTGELTGLAVPRVDIVVTSLDSNETQRRRVQ